MEVTVYVDGRNLKKALRGEIFYARTSTNLEDHVPLKFDTTNWNTGYSDYEGSNSITFFPNEPKKGI